MSFDCIKCNHKTTVIQTMGDKRRRKCLSPTCNETFYTEEVHFEVLGKSPATLYGHARQCQQGTH